MARRRSGRRYKKLDAFERRLRGWGIRLQPDANDYLAGRVDETGRPVIALFEGHRDGSGVLYLRSNPRTYEVLHEMAHILDFRKDPARWVNPASTLSLARTLREQACFNRLRNSRSWWRLGVEEQLHAMRYVDTVGGDSQFDLQTGRTVSRFRF